MLYKVLTKVNAMTNMYTLNSIKADEFKLFLLSNHHTAGQ